MHKKMETGSAICELPCFLLQNQKGNRQLYILVCRRGCFLFFFAVVFSVCSASCVYVGSSFCASKAGMVLEFMSWFLHFCWGCGFLCCCVVESNPPCLLLMLRSLSLCLGCLFGTTATERFHFVSAHYPAQPGGITTVVAWPIFLSHVLKQLLYNNL